jgi:flagellar biosynthesis protein FliR
MCEARADFSPEAARVGWSDMLGLFAADPLLGSNRIPIRIRIGAASLLTLVLVPTLPPPPPVDCA